MESLAHNYSYVSDKDVHGHLGAHNRILLHWELPIFISILHAVLRMSQGLNGPCTWFVGW